MCRVQKICDWEKSVLSINIAALDKQHSSNQLYAPGCLNYNHMCYHTLLCTLIFPAPCAIPSCLTPLAFPRLLYNLGDCCLCVFLCLP